MWDICINLLNKLLFMLLSTLENEGSVLRLELFM